MDIMMESTNNEDETNISNNQIVAESAGQGGGAADHEERIHLDRGNNNNNPLFFNEAPALRMNRMFSSAPAFEMLHSPVGSKRKAIDSPTARDVLCSSPQGEHVFLNPLLRRKREERKTAMAATVTSQKTTEVSPSTTSRLGYGEPVSPKSNDNELYRRSWPVSSMDDLDASLLHSSSGQGMPNNKRQRYQRRNSFFVHRDSNRRLAAASSILEDINRACFSGAAGGPADSSESASPPRRRTPRRETNPDEKEGVVYNTEERRSFSPEGGDDSSSDNDAILPRSMTAGSKKPEDNEEVNFWGNASWSNSDDTRWYSEFSSLSFSSQPTLPPPPPLGRPPRTTTHPGAPENEGTSTTDSTMLPPPPPRRQHVARTTASSSLQGKHDADHADVYSGRQEQQQQQQSLNEDFSSPRTPRLLVRKDKVLLGETAVVPGIMATKDEKGNDFSSDDHGDEEWNERRRRTSD